MINFEVVVGLNTQAAELLVQPESQFDDLTADLILRNTAVAVDRLSPAVFGKLSASTQDAIFDASKAAKDLAPSDPIDEEREAGESDAEYAYRTSVYHPLYSLQGKFHTSNFKATTAEEVARARQAVKLASKAFGAIARESHELPAIEETFSYFMNNAVAAATRIKRLCEQNHIS